MKFRMDIMLTEITRHRHILLLHKLSSQWLRIFLILTFLTFYYCKTKNVRFVPARFCTLDSLKMATQR